MIFIACQYVLVQWKTVLIVAQNVKQLDVYREEFSMPILLSKYV